MKCIFKESNLPPKSKENPRKPWFSHMCHSSWYFVSVTTLSSPYSSTALISHKPHCHLLDLAQYCGHRIGIWGWGFNWFFGWCLHGGGQNSQDASHKNTIKTCPFYPHSRSFTKTCPEGSFFWDLAFQMDNLVLRARVFQTGICCERDVVPRKANEKNNAARFPITRTFLLIWILGFIFLN